MNLWQRNKLPFVSMTTIGTALSVASSGVFFVEKYLNDFNALYGKWLDPDKQVIEELRQRSAPRTDIAFITWPISKAVNKLTHDGPELIEAI